MSDEKNQQRHNKNKPAMRSNRPVSALPVPHIPSGLQRNTDLDAMDRELSDIARPTPAIEAVGDKLPGFESALVAMQAQEYVVGEIYKVAIQNFQKSENNARMFYLAHEVDEMSQSLLQNGQDTPALGYVRDGRIVILDGQKRYQAAVSAGLSQLEVKITEKPESEASEYEASRRVNLVRSSQTAIDDAFVWRKLMERGVYRSQDELALRLGEKKEKVSKIIGITRIPERMIRLMLDHERTATWSVAYLVSTIFDAKRINDMGQDKVEDLAMEVIDEIVKKDLTKSQVEVLVSRKLQGPVKRATAESTPIRFGDNKGEIKVFPERGQLDLSFKGLDAQKIENLKATIERALVSS